MLVLISHEDDDICESNECVIGFIQFIIAGVYSSELLDISEVTFYNVTPFVEFLLPKSLGKARQVQPFLAMYCRA